MVLSLLLWLEVSRKQREMSVHLHAHFADEISKKGKEALGNVFDGCGIVADIQIISSIFDLPFYCCQQNVD